MNKQERKEAMRVLIDRQRFDHLFNKIDVATVNQLTGWCFPAYQRVRNPQWKTDNRCLAHTKDGETWEIWSWNKAIDNRVKFYDLQEAMRLAIAPQMQRYAATAESRCCVCKSEKFLTVDHKDKPFVAFVRDFMKSHPNVMDAIENDANGSGWYIGDPELKESWVLYHKVNATYQILCKSCNSKKGASHGNQRLETRVPTSEEAR